MTASGGPVTKSDNNNNKHVRKKTIFTDFLGTVREPLDLDMDKLLLYKTKTRSGVMTIDLTLTRL